MPMKTKSKAQVAYLLSKVSPLSSNQKGSLKRELKKGLVKVRPEENQVPKKRK